MLTYCLTYQYRSSLAMKSCFFLLTWFVIAAASNLTKPNIVFVLVDDWGHADVSFHNPAISSPNFQALADNGIILNHHYVFKYCSPSGVAFLTGRWLHHAHQYNIEQTIELGANINMTTIPAKLKPAGYKTTYDRQVARRFL